MSKKSNKFRFILYFIILFSIHSNAFAQDDSKREAKPTGKKVMWEAVNVSERDLYLGPGGEAMKPDLSQITFLKEEKNGHNKKYRIKDGAGKIWVAKFGREAQPETVAVRIMWALGYKTEVNYLVPSLTIPGKGTFQNVRLEARPEEIDRLDEWKWKDNPFIGTNEFQGLKMMMSFFNNWDVVDVQNKILEVDSTDGGKEYQYIISDLGATFGKLGNNNFPIVFRIGRKTNNPSKYIDSSFIDGVKDGKVDLAYKGKNRGVFEDITVEQAGWLADLLNQLTDKQIEDAFRAGNYQAQDIQTMKVAIKNRIADLSRAAGREKPDATAEK
jgi:hypothetical protein